ncbi:IS630 transposase-related protein [Acinetobacter sp. WU_MDCI_Abxb74]|uniref:IS630 transposase-related protein n=1 Tax=Acinetobacter sp. WU_MDCI_Abxb74 TaxID=2850072 RepID=UPI0021CDA774|nr:IS630 transposase-related protein [Acinetobacter sp. WU_MDCI_Abxb74]MCU4424426.1 IS630 transposase-related protein [Acinetobacter sp. WU_MDCI_Abxb74]
MRAYSLEFRQNVMAVYKQTYHKTKVCKQFQIARSTLDEWITLEEKTQNLNPLPVTRTGRPFSITDLKSFEDFVKSTPFSKIRELIEPFEQRFGYKVSYSILWRGLKKIGWKNKHPKKK